MDHRIWYKWVKKLTNIVTNLQSVKVEHAFSSLLLIYFSFIQFENFHVDKIIQC